jgi:hypothetical protein
MALTSERVFPEKAQDETVDESIHAHEPNMLDNWLSRDYSHPAN